MNEHTIYRPSKLAAGWEFLPLERDTSVASVKAARSVLLSSMCRRRRMVAVHRASEKGAVKAAIKRVKVEAQKGSPGRGLELNLQIIEPGLEPGAATVRDGAL